MSTYIRWPATSSSGVSSINSLTGAVTLAAGSGITLTPSGNTITIAASGGSGANVTLSNLTNPTAINQNLTFADASGGTYFIQTVAPSADVPSDEIFIRTGTQSFTGAFSGTGPIVVNSGDINASDPASTGVTGNMTFVSGDVLSGADPAATLNTGRVYISSGSVSQGLGDSGHTVLDTGTSAAGTRGKIQLKGGSEGTSGQVWTSTDTNGSGAWMAAGGGGFTPQFFQGPACTTNSGHLTANTFTTFNNSPTLTFTPTVTGTYKVYSSVPAIVGLGSADSPVLQITATNGSPTILATSQGTLYAAAGEPIFNTMYLQSVFTLTASIPYSFDIQGMTQGGGDYVEVTGGTAQFYIFAELVG